MSFINSLLAYASPKGKYLQGLLGKRVMDNNVTVKESCFSNPKPNPKAGAEVEQKNTLRFPLTTNF